MKRWLFFLVCLVAVVQIAGAASAGVIGSYTLYGGPWSGTVEYSWRTGLVFSDVATRPDLALFNGPDSEGYACENCVIDVFNNAGRTFWAASDQDDPEFSQVVNILTSSAPAYIWIFLDAIGYPVPTPVLVGRPVYDASVENLHGYTIDRIGLTITSASYTFDPQSQYPHTYSMAITATFEGAPIVPEPTSLIALIAGIGGLCGVGYRCRLKRIL